MTIAIRRPVGLVATLAAACVLLVGCGSGPSQVGSAVIVGDTAISDAQVQQELDNVLNTQATARQAQQQGKLDQVMRGIVTTHVLHELVARAAVREKLSVPDPQVDQLIGQAGGANSVAGKLSVDPADVHEAVRDILLEAALARKYADTLAVTFDYLVATSRQDATAKADQIAADPGVMRGLVQAASASGGAGQLGTKIALSELLQQSQSSSVPPLFAAEPGTVITFQSASSQGSPLWIVAVIRSRTGTAGSSGTGAAATSANLGALEAVGISLLTRDAKEAGVRVSPRYGEWDQVGMQVVSGPDQAAGVEVPLHGARS